MEKQIILFDGVCNLCNASVQFVIKHDDKNIFQFASLQSEVGQRLIEKFGLSKTNLDSFILVRNNKAFTKSTAALLVVRQLKSVIKLLYGFIILPLFIRDSAYNVIAKNRYKWFGKKNECMIPSPALKAKFL